jgi:pyridinium-3,5-biscarboxylic acid mononucleotide synthase
MPKTAAQRLLAAVRHGKVPLEAAIESLLEAAQDGLDDATLDHDRRRRLGHPEVVFGQGKTPAQVEAIVARLFARGGPVLVTRAEPEARARLKARFPQAHVHEAARTVRIGAAPRPRGRVAVVAAGTADLPVADEAIETLTALGSRVDRIADVGVAGLHRLVARMPLLKRARVAVVVAGMEGALPSVVQGLLDRPVVAVPTSVGYGAHFRGLAPLLAMLNSCAPGITVVNVDNGFGAGYAAHLINVTGLARPKARR